MIRFRYTLTPRTRVSAGRRGLVQTTRPVYDVVPGAVVRGALGTTWWTSPTHAYAGPDGVALFDRLFETAMSVSAAVPRVGAQEAQLEPLSWVKCKYPKEACSKGWHDDAVDVLSGATPWKNACPTCGGGVVRGKGWTLPKREDGREWIVRTTRTALKDGIAEDEKLFTRQAIEKDVSLTGVIDLDGDDLEEALGWLTAPKAVSIGGQRSTLGRCDWTCEAVVVPAQPDPGDLVVRLRSPAILLDDFGGASLDLGRAIEHACAGEVTEVARAWTRPALISGWHGIAGLPKPEEWALEAGSTAVIRGVGENGIRTLTRGLGVRRSEGYGEVELLTRAQAEGQIPVVEDRAEEQPGLRVNLPEYASTRAVVDDNVARLLRSISRDQQPATLRGLHALAREVRERRAAGDQRPDLEAVIAGYWTRPWARDLTAAQRDYIVHIMAAPNDVLAVLIGKLQKHVGGAQ